MAKRAPTLRAMTTFHAAGTLSRSLRSAREDQDSLGSVQFVLFPLNRPGEHWALLVADITEKTLTILDSIQGTVWSTSITQATSVLDQQIRPSPDTLQPWTTVVATVPQQDNGHDCGVFTIAFARLFLESHRDPEFLARFVRDPLIQSKRAHSIILTSPGI